MKPVGQPDWNAAINFAAEKKTAYRRLHSGGGGRCNWDWNRILREELQNFVSEQQVKIAQMVKSADRKTEEEKTAQQTNAEAEAENAVTPEVQDTDGLSEEDKTLYRQAKYAAKQYDYDKAISMLQNSETYQTSEKFQHAVKVYQKKKESCVSWPLDQVTHVFYHTLIKDTGKALMGITSQEITIRL